MRSDPPVSLWPCFETSTSTGRYETVVDDMLGKMAEGRR